MIVCDTSTAALLYVPDAGAESVRAMLESADGVALSDLARTELLSVFHRRRREGLWSEADFKAAVLQFSRDEINGFWTWLPLDEHVTRAAALLYTGLPPEVFLRAADSLHLATALEHGFTEIHTHDRHQAAAAGALGLRAVTIGG